MWKCWNCKHKFSEPETAEEDRGECRGVRCSETFYVCPKCGIDDIEEIEEDEEDEYYD